MSADEQRKPDRSASTDILRIAHHQDREAFVRLFLDYAPKVKSYLIHVGVTQDLAEDLAQETLARVWRHAGAFDPGKAAASAWIFAIARNLRIDAMRRDRHPSAANGLMPTTQSEPETPAEVFENGERERRVRDAMLGLPAEQFEVLRMSFFLGQTHVQIADQLRLPLGTVKSRLRLALTRVRGLLGEDL